MVNMDALVMGNDGVLPQGVDGLLGIKYMQYFGIVDFDFKRQYLSVYPYDAMTEVSKFFNTLYHHHGVCNTPLMSTTQTGSRELRDLVFEGPADEALMARGVPMRQDPTSGIFFVDLHLKSPSSPPVPAIVDLGVSFVLSIIIMLCVSALGITHRLMMSTTQAGMSLINWKAANQVGIQRSDPEVMRDAMSVWGIDGSTVPVDIVDFKSLYMEKQPLSRSRIGVADLPAFGLIGYGNRPVGLLGMDIFGGGDKRMIFDFRQSRLYTK